MRVWMISTWELHLIYAKYLKEGRLSKSLKLSSSNDYPIEVRLNKMIRGGKSIMIHNRKTLIKLKLNIIASGWWESRIGWLGWSRWFTKTLKVKKITNSFTIFWNCQTEDQRESKIFAFYWRKWMRDLLRSRFRISKPTSKNHLQRNKLLSIHVKSLKVYVSSRKRESFIETYVLKICFSIMGRLSLLISIQHLLEDFHHIKI